jgi:hypothetical protein
MDAASVPTWLSITETAVKIVAIGVAGGWTLYLFSALRQAARARLEVDKLHLEREKIPKDIEKISGEIAKLNLEIAKLDLEMKRQAVIGIAITATQPALAGDPSKYLSVVVEVTNNGTRTAKLSYEKDSPPFAVTAVSFNPAGQPMFGDSLRLPVLQAASPTAPALSTIVRAGASESLPFVCRVNGPGVYFVTFRVQVSPEERGEVNSLGVPTERPVSWTGKAYVAIT